MNDDLEGNSQELAVGQFQLPGIHQSQWKVLKAPIPTDRIYTRIIGVGQEAPYFDARLIQSFLGLGIPMLPTREQMAKLPGYSWSSEF